MDILAILSKLLIKNGLVTAFVVVGITTHVAYTIAGKFNKKTYASALAIFFGLVLAYIGGITTGGHKGLASIPVMAGIGFMGGGMLRDFAITATAFGVELKEIKKCGFIGVLALFLGIISSFVVGVVLAYIWGYNDVISLVTIGAGVVTLIVGPVTGTALGASSEVITISVAAGVVKSVAIMVLTPLLAKVCGIDNPKSAMIYGGLLGSTSGTSAGMAAVNPKLVPYAAMCATFYTGLGCLMCPSILFLAVQAILV